MIQYIELENPIPLVQVRHPHNDWRLIPLALCMWLMGFIATGNQEWNISRFLIVVLISIVFTSVYSFLGIITSSSASGAHTWSWRKYIQNFTYRSLNQSIVSFVCMLGLMGLFLGNIYVQFSHQGKRNSYELSAGQWIGIVENDEFLTHSPQTSSIKLTAFPVKDYLHKNTTHENSVYTVIMQIPQGLPIPTRKSVIGFSGSSMRILPDHHSYWLRATQPITIIAASPWYIRWADICRHRFRQTLEHTSPISQAILPGLVLGDARGITPNIKSNFTASGALHTLVFSGANFAVIVLFFHFLTRKCIKSVKLRYVMHSLLIVVVVTVVGWSPAILRAALMAIITGALYMNPRRTRSSMNIVAFVIIVLIGIWPANSHDVGFALSILSVVSIISWSRKCARVLEEKSKYFFHKVHCYYRQSHNRFIQCFYYENNYSQSQWIRGMYQCRTKIIKIYYSMLQILAVTCVCTLGTSLITSFFHAHMGLGTLITNVCCEPLLACITIIGQIVVIIACFSPDMAYYGSLILGFCADRLYDLVCISAHYQSHSSLSWLLDFPIPVICVLWLCARYWKHVSISSGNADIYPNKNSVRKYQATELYASPHSKQAGCNYD